jgi:hypothetical protein
MTHVYFDTEQVDWAPYLRQQQVGQGYMMGGRDDVQDTDKIFRGTKYMRGYGVKSTLSSIGRFLLPIASNLMQSAKEEAGSTLGKIGADMAEGKPFQETIRAATTAAARNLGARVQQCGKGRRKKIIKQLAIADISGDQVAEPIVSGPNPIPKRRGKKRDYLDL